MPNIVTPMSYEVALCWEAWAFFFGLIAIIVAIVVWSLVIIVVGSIVCLVAIMICLTSRSYGLAVVFLAVWLICVGLISIAHEIYWEGHGRSKAFREKIVFDFSLLGYRNGWVEDNGGGYIYELRDGRTIWAQSYLTGAKGNFKTISPEKKRLLVEKAMRSIIYREVSLSSDDNSVKCFVDFQLGKDYKDLIVIIDGALWQKFNQGNWIKNRLCMAIDYNLGGYIGFKQGDSGVFGYTYTLKVYDTNHRLLATAYHPSGQSPMYQKVKLY